MEERGSVRGTLLVMFATIGVLTLVGFVSCAALVGFGISSVSKAFSEGSVSTFSSTTQNRGTNISFSTPRKNDSYIAGIKFDSEINNTFADDIIAKLRFAQHDEHAVGVFIEVNSPGGSVVPSQEIYDVVKEIAKEKPVVAYVREMMASGAYYALSPSTEIVANRGSIIGSIGVIMQSFEVDELLKSLKIQPNTIKTGALKDAGSPFHPMTNEDKTYLKGLIDTIFETFMDDVKKVRPGISQKDLGFMSDGRVVLAKQAQTLNLIDLIGSQELAKNEIARLAKLKSTPDVFYYEDLRPFTDLLTEKFISGSSKTIKEIFVNRSQVPTF